MPESYPRFMKSKLTPPLILCALMAVPTMAQELKPETPLAPPDREKVSYALGMNIGMLHKQTEVNKRTDIPTFTRAVTDTLDGKPTELKEAEIGPLLQQAGSAGLAAQFENDKRKISYALGMRMAIQIRSKYAEADGAIVAQAINDVLDEKPTKIQQPEITPLLQQAVAWGKLKQSEKNKAEGQTFLAKNLKTPGIETLPDGLQYRVVQQGSGVIPSTNDLVYIKMRGSFVDGRQFIRHNHYLIRCGGGCQGWQDALPRMKIGSQWQIFIPPDLAFGEQGEAAWGVGPDATLVFDLEMLSIAPPNAEFGRGRLGHAFEDSDIPDPPATDQASQASTRSQK